MPSCFLIHGHSYKTKNLYGRTTIDRLKPYLKKRGWTPLDFDYDATFYSPHPLYWYGLGGKLADRAQVGDIAISSSAGASVVHMALRRGAPFRQVILINPVLRKNAVFPEGQLRDIRVWYSSSDTTVAGAAYAKYGLPFTPWGAMGLHGHVGDDPRVKNIDAANDFKELYGESAPGHCEVFRENLAFWAPQY